MHCSICTREKTPPKLERRTTGQKKLSGRTALYGGVTDSSGGSGIFPSGQTSVSYSHLGGQSENFLNRLKLILLLFRGGTRRDDLRGKSRIAGQSAANKDLGQPNIVSLSESAITEAQSGGKESRSTWETATAMPGRGDRLNFERTKTARGQHYFSRWR